MKKMLNVVLACGLACCMTGCGKKETASEVQTDTPTQSATTVTEAPEGTYFSEITGMPISISLQNQRPVAVMVDCEQIAFPHYGIAEADVVYEIMNNVENGRVTRFMPIYKDYDKVAEIGNIRSTRTTNVWLAGEWNAILIHDGQASYALDYLYEDYAAQHLSSGFTRVDNGKPSEFTEYAMAGEISSRIQAAGYDVNYNQYKQEGDHFTFVKYNTTLDISSFNNATSVVLPFPHNETTLAYNSSTKSYDLSMYGELHKDAEDGQVLTFTNALLLNTPFTQYPEGGYVYYNIVNSTGDGYYLTNGKMEPITWKKGGETDITHYYDANGNELEMNRGKTYISLVPSDVWSNLAIQ